MRRLLAVEAVRPQLSHCEVGEEEGEEEEKQTSPSLEWCQVASQSRRSQWKRKKRDGDEMKEGVESHGEYLLLHDPSQTMQE